MRDDFPLLLIPGLACTGALFSAQIAALKSARAVLVADHAAHDSMGAIAEAILAEAPARFHLAGLSMGGYIALEIMRQAPERVGRLCLMDTSARADTPEKTTLRREALAEVAAGRYLEMSRVGLPLTIAASRGGDDALAEAIMQQARDTGSEVWTRQTHAIMGRVDSRPDLPAIKAQTLVIVGDEDQVTPPDHAEEMARLIPDARLEVIGDCGHMSSMERPEQVTALLQEWLA
ncbi:MAG TPA: alpha/beta fold hydrolase [Aliiroseovarius sp.]|nr:alpha/beta fold hydrolase [Aliiroseovarius sp.]